MPIIDAEAVVLRHYSLAEADRIVVFFTREFGKIRAVAAGVRKTSSRLGGVLELLNHVRIQVYGREGGDLYRIRQCEIIHSFLGKRALPERMCVGCYFAECISEFVQENYPSPLLFRLLLATLSAGETRGVSEALVRYFEIWLLKLSGLLPDYGYCSGCGECVKGIGLFAMEASGLALCARCAHGRGMRIGPSATALIDEILTRPPDDFAIRTLAEPVSRDLENLTQTILVASLEKRLKSYRGLKEALGTRR